MVDIATMVATCHALKSSPAEGNLVRPRKLRSRLRRDIKRGAVAYIDALARTRRGIADDGLLCKWRVAAEQQMPLALAHQESLGHIMANEAGSLDGLAAVRQDLWRPAHMAIYVSGGMATLRESATLVPAHSADALAGRLRRRLRKALIAHAWAALRSRAPKGRLVVKAREAALAEKGENNKVAQQVRSSAGIAVFAGLALDKARWVDVGRCYERFALQTTSLGIRNAFLNQPVEVAALRPAFAAALGLGGQRPDLVVRFGRGPVMPRSLRRPVEAVMV